MNSMLLKLATTQGTSLKVDSGDVSQGVADATKGVTDATQDAVNEVNQATQYLQEHLSDLIGFGVKVLIAIAVFMIGRVLIQFIRKIVRKSLARSSADKGVEQFVDSVLKFSLYFLLIFMIAAKLGVDTTSVAAIIASGGVAIGLALQGSLSNFAGGVLILLLKPFEVGDYIIEDTNHNEGTVKEIQIFYTKLSTVDNKTIVIPNGMLTNNSLTNATAKAERKLDLKVDIAYEADLRKAKAVIEEIIRQDDATIKNEEILVFVHELAESSVVIGARAWVKNEDYWNARWRILEEIKLKLDENEIEMAYPHLTVQICTARPADLLRLFGHKRVVEPVHVRPVAVPGGVLPHLGKAGQLIGGKFAGIGGVIIQRLLHHRVDLGLELLIGCLIDELVIVPAVAHKVIEGLIPEISGRAPAKLHRDDVFLRAAQGHKLIEVGLQPPHGREAGGHGLRLRDLLVGGRHMQRVGQLLHGHLRI